MSDAIRAFDRSAGGYDDWYREAKGRQVLEAERSLVNRMIPGEGIGLEIGAGTGIFAESLTKDDHIVICLDLSIGMLTKAKQRGLPCVLGSAEFLPIRMGILGFSYMITVLEFLPIPVRAFTEAAKISSSLVVLFVNKDSSWGRLYSEMASHGDQIFRYANFYSLEDVIEISRASMLTFVESYGTLTTTPTDPGGGFEIVEPGPNTGVVAVKLTNRMN